MPGFLSKSLYPKTKRAKKRGGKRMRGEYWIAGAVGEKGSLREEVMRRYGREGFDAKGRIKSSVLRKIIARNSFKKQAVLARTLRGLRKRKGKRK